MIVLPRSKVHLWSCSLRPSPAELERRRAVLSDAELARALRFRHEADSIAYVAAHGWLRLVLAAYAGLPPARLRFRETPLGKPSLEPVGEMPPVAFNLSHSGDLAIVAVSAGMPIGIDIERIGSVPDAATGDYLAHAEGAMLSTLPGSLRDEAFTRCWTRKEAYLKATGAGLNTPLTDFAVSLAPSAPARLLWVRSDPREAARWQLVDLSPAAGYCGAIAARAQGWSCVWMTRQDGPGAGEGRYEQ